MQSTFLLLFGFSLYVAYDAAMLPPKFVLKKKSYEVFSFNKIYSLNLNNHLWKSNLIFNTVRHLATDYQLFSFQK